MTKAIVRNGEIRLLEPLPPDWREGTELRVELLNPSVDASATDRWMDEVEALAAQQDPRDDAIIDEAIAAIRQEAKELARKGKR
jgi:hypothetical protein